MDGRVAWRATERDQNSQFADIRNTLCVMPAIEEIRRSIEDQLQEIDNQVASLTAALKALNGDAGASRARNRSRSRAIRSRAAGRGAGEAAARGRRPLETTAREPQKPAEPDTRAQSEQRLERRPAARGRRREVLSADQVAGMLAESGDGLSAIAIAKQAAAPYNRVADALRELQAAGRVRQQGTRRTSRWVAITDEERIQARAAELASRSTQR